MNPAPTWIIADSAPYFSSSEFSDFCARSGVGLLLAPGETHWLLGHEERKIQTLKRTAARLEKEGLGLSIEATFSLAAHCANSSINSSGFCPFQWSRGWQRDEIESLPGRIRPSRANAGPPGESQGAVYKSRCRPCCGGTQDDTSGRRARKPQARTWMRTRRQQKCMWSRTRLGRR